MIKIKEVILVEGRYDKNAIRQVVDATVLETGGFGIFRNRDQVALIRKLSEKRGVILLTDSDGAGFVIRGHLKGSLQGISVKNAYIPQIVGKEKRKRTGSREGYLGVEGMKPEVLIKALLQAGATVEDADAVDADRDPITKADMFAAGLTGNGSTARRCQLLKKLELPASLTPNGLLEVLNVLYTRDEFLELARNGELL